MEAVAEAVAAGAGAAVDLRHRVAEAVEAVEAVVAAEAAEAAREEERRRRCLVVAAPCSRAAEAVGRQNLEAAAA